MHLAVEVLGSTRGGGWVILNEVLESLTRDVRFTKITVFASPQSPYAEDAFLHPKIKWEIKSLQSDSYIARTYWFARGLSRQIKKLNPDVLLLLNGIGNADIATINYIQQPLFFDPRSRKTLSKKHRMRLRIVRALTIRSCRRASAVFVQTQWMKESMVRDWGIEPMVVRSPPPKIEGFSPKKKRSTILWIGSELPYKRKTFFEKAALVLRQESYPHNFLALCSSNAAKSRDEVLNILKESSILALTSTTESLGLPTLEAMAKGTAVLAPNLPYSKEICGDAALFYQWDSLEDFTAKLRMLLDDDSLRDEYARKGTQRARELFKESADYKKLRDQLFEAKT